MQNIKKYLDLKTLFYALMLVFAYYLGDADLKKIISRKLNISTNALNVQKIQTVNLGEYLVTKIVDGDTVHVVDSVGKEEVLRFLAVDTLEKNALDAREKCFANMESKFTEENLLNKKVILQNDPTQSERDKYGRLLVYVSLAGSPQTFNETLLSTGNARVYKASPPAVNYKKYVELQTEAQKNNLGMWNTELCR